MNPKLQQWWNRLALGVCLVCGMSLMSQAEYSTYFGGDGSDRFQNMAVDFQGNIIGVGYTQSTNLPVTGNAYQATLAGGNDAFVVKLTSDGKQILYCSYLGGSAEDSARGVAVDGEGNIYIVGSTYSSNFPTTGNAYSRTLSGGRDAFVVKLNAEGQMEHSTYLGGGNWDYGYCIAAENEDEIYVGGFTHGSFPVTSQAAQFVFGGSGDGFVTKLNTATGAMVYSTYLGGENYESMSALTIKNGVVYIAAGSGSPDFPTTADALDRENDVPGINGGGDAALTVLAADGKSFLYSTFFGKDQAYHDAGFSDSVMDAEGNLVMVGYINESGWEMSPSAAQSSFAGGNADGLFMKFNPATKQIMHMTYFGGSGEDAFTSVSMDTDGNYWVTGYTDSATFPNGAAAYGGQDSIVVCFSPAGQVLGSSRIGGNGNDQADGLLRSRVVPGSGTLCLNGFTNSTDFPTTSDALQKQLKGTADGYLVVKELSQIVPSLNFTPTMTRTVTPTCTPTVTPTVGQGNPYSLSITASSLYVRPGGHLLIQVASLYNGLPKAGIWIRAQVITGAGLINGQRSISLSTGVGGVPARIDFTASGQPIVQSAIIKIDDGSHGNVRYVLLVTLPEPIDPASVQFPSSGASGTQTTDFTAIRNYKTEGEARDAWEAMSANISSLAATVTPTPCPWLSIGTVQIFPNPARGRVTFAYTLAGPVKVKIDIYRLTGERVARIEEHKDGGAGQTLTTAWEAAGVAPGVYFCRIVATDASGKEVLNVKKKVALVK